MKKRGKWAIVVASALFVSLLLMNYPVTACFGHTTSCEGVSVYQGDGGSTDYWYADLYPPAHNVTPGTGTSYFPSLFIFTGGSVLFMTASINRRINMSCP